MAGHTVIAFQLAVLAMAVPTVWASFASKVKGHSIPVAVYFGALVCVVAAGALFFIGILRRNATEMAVTSKRVIVKTGIAERRTVEILLSRIESVAVDEPALGRLLGYGTVIVRGTGGTPGTVDAISNPMALRGERQG